MRIISGKRRGYKLISPDGLSTRPTTDRVKESVFNIIQTRFPCALVLDLFAGSGALGIEALSRGAETAVFVDSSGASVDIIKKNLKGSGLGDSGLVFKEDSFKFLKRLRDPEFSPFAENGRQFCGFDIIFLDPPYNKGLVNKAAAEIDRLELLAEHGIIVAETEFGGESVSGDDFNIVKKA